MRQAPGSGFPILHLEYCVSNTSLLPSVRTDAEELETNSSTQRTFSAPQGLLEAKPQYPEKVTHAEASAEKLLRSGSGAR